MPSHLRSGKDLSFEQQLAAEKASEKAAERAQYHLGRAATEQAQHQLQNAAKPHGVAGFPNANEYHSAAEIAGSSSSLVVTSEPIPSGYNLSPAVLERLRRAQQQFSDARSGRNQSAQEGANLPTTTRPGSSPL
jgi:hypothetical protein